MNTLNRRHLLAAGAAELLGGCASAPGPSSTATTTTAAELAATYRWVNRLSWGAGDADLNQALVLGRDAWLRAQLSPGRPAPLPAAVQAHIDALDISRQPLDERRRALAALRQDALRATSEADRQAARQAYQQRLAQLGQQTAQRQVLRALYASTPLHELMSWFWFNHFNVHLAKHQVRLWLADYEDQALRPHALGSFRAMLGAATRHAAMLQYLDNAQNAARRLNENHARELLELHTLGVDGGYTQADVQELARVLTGHGLAFGRRAGAGAGDSDDAEGGYAFHPARHDAGDKRLLGQPLRQRGEAELDEVLDRLVAHPSTARFVSRKIARFLLGNEPPADLLDAMAARFAESRGQIAPVLQELVASRAFNDAPPAFKTPMHLVLGALRLAAPEPTDAALVAERAPGWLTLLGQGLYQRSTPDGYPAQAEAWNSPGQMAQRFDLARAVGAGRGGAGGPPPLAGRRVVQQVLLPALRAPSRQALDAAASRADWNALLLASPEYQFR